MAALALLCATGVGAGCGSSTNTQTPSQTGGTSSVGGSNSTGGSSSSGGSSSAGGTSAASSTGGASAAGGSATGGSKATGGIAAGGSSATGGSATGGSKAAGGTAAGGSSATGGSATGGDSGAGGVVSGGASGAGGATGGSTANGGASGTPDAGSSKDAAEKPTGDGSATPQYTCNEIIGGSLAGEWFAAGFKTFVDGARWQIIPKSEAYTNLWADPANAIWSTPITSPCTNGSKNPDRVIFIAFNWTYTTAAQWQTDLEKIITNIQTKYTNVKRIDLMTMIRSPGNKTCGQATQEDIVQPFIDQAIATVVAASHTVQVTAAPKFYVPDCATFGTGSPHFTPAGNTAMAKIIGTFYATDQ